MLLLTFVVLVMVLAMTLAIPTLAFAQNRPPIQRQDQIAFAINDKGVIFMGGDISLGKCSDLLQHRDEVPDLVKLGALRACEKAGYSATGSPTQDRVEPQTPLTKTGGLPIILVPIALLLVGGLLIRKSTPL